MINKNILKEKISTIPPISSFDVQISYGDIQTNPEDGVFPEHTHDMYEIFVPVSGNMSFVVRDNLYSLSHGDVLIIRPGENHHSVFLHKCHCKYYFLLFSIDKSNSWFDDALNIHGMGCSLISLKHDKRAAFLECCEKMLCDKSESSSSIQFLPFFELISILSTPDSISSVHQKQSERSFACILNYIRENYNTPISSTSVAEHFHITLKTLERQFRKYMSDTPKNYLRVIRLTRASALLREGRNVTEACFESGFRDCSRFIDSFKKYYGETPLQYRTKYMKALGRSTLE